MNRETSDILSKEKLYILKNTKDEALELAKEISLNELKYGIVEVRKDCSSSSYVIFDSSNRGKIFTYHFPKMEMIALVKNGEVKGFTQPQSTSNNNSDNSLKNIATVLIVVGIIAFLIGAVGGRPTGYDLATYEGIDGHLRLSFIETSTTSWLCIPGVIAAGIGWFLHKFS